MAKLLILALFALSALVVVNSFDMAKRDLSLLDKLIVSLVKIHEYTPTGYLGKWLVEQLKSIPYRSSCRHCRGSTEYREEVTSIMGTGCKDQTIAFLEKIGVTDVSSAHRCCSSLTMCYSECGSDLDECDIHFHHCFAKVASEQCPGGDNYCWVKTAAATNLVKADYDVFKKALNESYGCSAYLEVQEKLCQCV